MMNIVWFMWALQLSGFAAIGWERLWLISLAVTAISVCLKSISITINQKKVIKELEQCGDVEDDAAIATMLALILHKIATK